MRVTRHCACGGMLVAQVIPNAAAATVADLFDRVHTGNGHSPASVAVAAAARCGQRYRDRPGPSIVASRPARWSE